MNVILWVIQIILSIKMITVCYTHGLRQSQPAMQEAIQNTGKYSLSLLHLISIGAFIGVIGLILPGVTGSSIWITPAAAAILAAMLLASIFFHVRSRVKPNIFVSLILAAFAAFVACGRWMLVPG